MRRVKNLFLLNLALADLLVTLICMPMVVGQTVFRLWVYGAVMCKLSVYTQGTFFLSICQRYGEHKERSTKLITCLKLLAYRAKDDRKVPHYCSIR